MLNRKGLCVGLISEKYSLLKRDPKKGKTKKCLQGISAINFSNKVSYISQIKFHKEWYDSEQSSLLYL